MKASIIDRAEMEDLLKQAARAVASAPPGTIFDEITVLNHGDDGGLVIRTGIVPRGFLPGRLKKKRKPKLRATRWR